MSKTSALVVALGLAAFALACGGSKPVPSHETNNMASPARADVTPLRTSAAPAQPAVASAAVSAEKYTCSMHPEVISDKPGKCPKCGMTLVPVTSLGNAGDHDMAAEDEGEAAAPAAATGRLVNVNTATLAELDAVNGIGLVTANKIIAYREAHGSLKSIEDLKSAGVTHCVLGKIKDKITFTGGSASTASSTTASSPTAGSHSGHSSAAASSPAASSPAASSGPRTNINTATLADLDAVDGIGEATARKIIAARQSAGNKFSNWGEVDAVSGVGATTLEKLKTAFELN